MLFGTMDLLVFWQPLDWIETPYEVMIAIVGCNSFWDIDKYCLLDFT